MNILVLGGTGAMGRPLVDKLSKDNIVYVTSRTAKTSTENIKYLQGNATQIDFIDNLLKKKSWDCIVDFMVHSESVLKTLLPKILNNTKQYVFISSARVYSQSETPITEETPRLLDVCQDEEYLKTNEYALAKAREENLLFNSGKNNFTIIRPTITYNTHRLQLGVLEKENWLYRALRGRSIVFSEDINNKLTTMTHGDDVSIGIASIIGKEEALGEAFHITYPASLPWNEVLKIYLNVLKKHTGKDIPVVMTQKSTNLKFKNRIYQLIYSRYFNRTFNNSKIAKFTNISNFTAPQQGLANCLQEFLKKPQFGNIAWELEAVNDKIAGERTPLREIPHIGNKIKYFCYRNNLKPLFKIYDLSIKALNKIKRIITK